MKKIVLTLLMSGCATTPQYQWVGPGTDQEWYANHAECLSMAGPKAQHQNPGTAPVSGGGFSGGMISGMWAGQNLAAQKAANQQRQAIYLSCMRGKGYELRRI